MRFKILGYISYLFGVGGLVFTFYILMEESSNRVEDVVALAIIVLVSISQMLFNSITLKTIEHRSYKKIDAIDEYLTVGIDDANQIVQLPLIWRIVGWVVILCALAIMVFALLVLEENVSWRRDYSVIFFSLLAIFISLITLIYSLRVVNRKWIGKGEKMEL